MRPGSVLMPASFAAITKGLADASDPPDNNCGLSYGTKRPMKKIVPMKKNRIRKNVFRIAAGTFFRGFSVSPAAIPTSSVPWYENPAWMSTAQNPTNFETGFSGTMR